VAYTVHGYRRNKRILSAWRWTPLPTLTIKRESIMKYYFILTDGKDAWMQFVYLPSGDYVSGYIRDLRSVGVSVHDYDLWTKNTRPIAERTLERIRKRMTAG